MRATFNIVIALSLAAFALASSGCQKEGPAERAGKDIDKAVKKAHAKRRADRLDPARRRGGFRTLTASPSRTGARPRRREACVG